MVGVEKREILIKIIKNSLIVGVMVEWIFLQSVSAAEVISLERMEQLLKEKGASFTRAEENIASAKRDYAQLLLLPEIFGGADVGRYPNIATSDYYTIEQKDPLTGIVSTRQEKATPSDEWYGESQVYVGIRYPLFGSKDALEYNLYEAKGQLEIEKSRSAAQVQQNLMILRRSYGEYYFKGNQIALSQFFLLKENAIKKALLRRQESKLLLRNDRLEFETLFDLIRRNVSMFTLEKEDALSRMQSSMNVTLGDFIPQYPVSTQNRSESLDKHPQLQLYRTKLDEAIRLAQMDNSSISKGSISGTVGITTIFGKGSGESAILALNMSIPMSMKSESQMQRRIKMAEVQKRRIELDSQEHALEREAIHVKLLCQSKRDNFIFASNRLVSAVENYRIVRLKFLKGESEFETAVKANYELYGAANAYIESQIDYYKGQVDADEFAGNGCGNIGENDLQIKEIFKAMENSIDIMPTPPILSPVLLNTSDLREMEALLFPDTPLSMKDTLWENGDKLGWYSWHGFTEYKSSNKEMFWIRISESKRLLLSFTAEELKQFQSDKAEVQTLQLMIKEAHAHGIKVEWLLGDSSWVLPGGEKALSRTLDLLENVGWDGIQLDIEASQLPKDQQPLWRKNIASLVRSIAERTPLSIGLSIHDRYGLDDKLIEDLIDSGLKEVILMTYSTNRVNVQERVSKVLRHYPTLLVAVAQSVEPIEVLSQDESYATLGQSKAILSWRNLASELSQYQNFNGIVVQSMEDFQRMFQ
jgi:outer membrane protein TolC